MKLAFTTILLFLMSISTFANPIADPEPVPVPAADPASAPLDARIVRPVVTCQVTTANAARQRCAQSSTNQCPIVGRFALGASVRINCYVWGDIVGTTSLWFYLSTNDFIPATYVQNCYGVGPC